MGLGIGIGGNTKSGGGGGGASAADKALVQNATQYGLAHNLYKVMEEVKKDPRVQGYAAIMLCQYYKGYNSLSLEGGADAFLTSDGDFYQGNAVHYWHDSNDEYFDRWIAMLFSSESGSYTCSNASLCPRAALIDGTMGDINLSASGMRFAWIDVTEGSSFGQIYSSSYQYINSWNRSLVLLGQREIKRGATNSTTSISGCNSAIIGVKKISNFFVNDTNGTCNVIQFVGTETITGVNSSLCTGSGGFSSLGVLIANELVSAHKLFYGNVCATNIKRIEAKKLMSITYFSGTTTINNTGVGYSSLIHLEIGQGFYSDLNIKPCSFANCIKTDANDLVEDKIANPTWSNLDQFLYNFEHLIVDKLADLSGQTAKTITLAATPYAAITSEIRAKMSAKNWNLASA